VRRSPSHSDIELVLEEIFQFLFEKNLFQLSGLFVCSLRIQDVLLFGNMVLFHNAGSMLDACKKQGLSPQFTIWNNLEKPRDF